jgi:hypothetical protein
MALGLAAHARYAVNRPPRFQRGVLCQHHTLPRSSAGLSFWLDVLPNCNDTIRGYMQPGASRQRQRIVADVPMAAARRSTGGPVPRKDEPTATTSSKRHPVGSILLSRSHPHQRTVPANPCAPHARPGPFSRSTPPPLIESAHAGGVGTSSHIACGRREVSGEIELALNLRPISSAFRLTAAGRTAWPHTQPKFQLG